MLANRTPIKTYTKKERKKSPRLLTTPSTEQKKPHQDSDVLGHELGGPGTASLDETEAVSYWREAL
ncbi:unnamed protein product [Nyctereutes procyonoides]|uniref:(raccoon dog) hypothetical protein n=1 Tax=Nyctereutes procyonoides TaxID=34880 RepID=A0A811ZCQ4_NYCPR|nr:unnamed protein product [Nyctereutes procyonoides]